MTDYKIKVSATGNTINIFLCFLLTSTGYFLWLYNLRNMMTAEAADIMTTVIGYTLQAVGIFAYSAMVNKKPDYSKKVFLAAVVMYIAFLVPSALSHSVLASLAFGFADSLLCGVIAGHYLYCLTAEVEKGRRALTFGTAYGLSTIVSWLISLLKVKNYNGVSLIICFALAVITVALNIGGGSIDCKKPLQAQGVALPLKKLLLPSAALLLLFSLVNNVSFVVQSTDASAVSGIEFSRMFYGAGLVFAGIISDKNRKYGAVCALSSLAIPFITLSLSGEAVPQTIFWALGYFAFGFYAVFRIILFSDIAEKYSLMFLSCFGLMLGRTGDAVGTGLTIILKEQRVALVILAAAVFAVSVLLFFRVHQLLYNQSPAEKSEREVFNEFAFRHDLSQREREVLRFLLSEKTNKEIAEALYVSESTVKFHIHNLLKKTGAKNRLELLLVYNESAQK